MLKNNLFINNKILISYLYIYYNILKYLTLINFTYKKL